MQIGDGGFQVEGVAVLLVHHGLDHEASSRADGVQERSQFPLVAFWVHRSD